MMRGFLIVVISAALIGMLGCKRKGCTDPAAENYDPKAKVDDGSCVYPPVTFDFNASTGDGNVTSNGGSGSRTSTWNNTTTKAEYDISVNISEGTFRFIIKDAAGKVVFDKTYTPNFGTGVGVTYDTGCTQPGTPGEWSITVEVNNFSGTATYSLFEGTNCQ